MRAADAPTATSGSGGGDRPRTALVGLWVLVALTWLASLVAVGFVSSRTDPVVGASTQNLLFAYVLLLPAFGWLGVHLVRLRHARRPATAGLEAGRRRLLVDGASLVGVTVVGAAASRPVLFAAADPHVPTEMVTDEHGSPGGRRALVAYDSQYGSTAEVADRIGRMLAESGHRVDVRHVADVDTIAEYELVVVGAPIQYDTWMPGATDFVRTHRRHLATVPVALFFTCLALSRPGDAALRSADQYERKIRSIAPELDLVGVGRFAGVLDYSRMTPVTRIFARVLLTLRGADAGDHRDWSQIRSWADGLTSSGPRT